MKELQLKEELIRMIMEEHGAKKLFKSWENQNADIAFPGLFPYKSCRDAVCLQEYLRGLHTLPQDLLLRVALFFLCFDTKKALDAAQTLTMEPDTKEMILDAIRLREEFYFVSDIYKVKKFLFHYGEDRFVFLQRISLWQIKLHGHAEMRNEARAEYFKIVKESGDPIYICDLKISEDDLRQIGIPKERIAQVQTALLDFVHKFPHCNNNELLLNKAKNMNGTLSSKLIKKFLGRY